eukprot:477072-Amphidinium_carterae.1
MAIAETLCVESKVPESGTLKDRSTLDKCTTDFWHSCTTYCIVWYPTWELVMHSRDSCNCCTSSEGAHCVIITSIMSI